MQYHQNPYNDNILVGQVCSHQTFFDQTQLSQQCEMASNACANQFVFINLLKFTYCTLDGIWIAAIILSFLLIMLILLFIKAVVEEYLAPSIAYITLWLEISQALGAVTLLAFANGSGDVISAIAASGELGGLPYILGSIYGAGLFVCSMVVAITILSSEKNIKLDPTLIWREVLLYIVSTFLVLIFAFIGSLDIFSAILLLLLYLTLVLVVFIQDLIKQPKKMQEKQMYLNTDSTEFTDKHFRDMDLVYLPEDKTPEELLASPEEWKNVMDVVHESDEEDQEEVEHWVDMGLLDRLFYVIDFPFMILRTLTLPSCHIKKYSKRQVTMFPIPFMILLCFCFSSTISWYAMGSLCVVGCSLSLLIHRTSHHHEPPKYYVILQFCGTVGSVVWTYIVSSILIDVMQFLGIMSKLDKTYMGLTIIAISNSLPDAITTIAFAKQGYAVMGLTGAYGQLFGLLIGFGFSLLLKTMSDGPQQFNLFDPNELANNFVNIFIILVTLLNLSITFFYSVTHKYRFTPNLAKIIVTVYVLFLFIVTQSALVHVFE